MISIVIPAHNEAAVIARTLSNLLDGAQPGELEVVVVANACTDNTADIARSFPGVRVIETATPGKTNALNLGEQATSAFPRFYVDADVILPLESLRAVARLLGEGKVHAAAPRMVPDLAESNFFVRAFYRLWLRLPYCLDGMIAGAYGLSEEGRRRFGAFPAVTADDAFVRLHFASHERQVLRHCTFTVVAPRSLSALIRIKTRGHFGNIELRKQFPQLLRTNDVHHGGALLGLALRPWLWPGIAVYLYVRAVSRLRSYQRYHWGKHDHWERDETSRQVAAHPS
jgi:glycosyltransferase involved in cell wall biosynthesis